MAEDSRYIAQEVGYTRAARPTPAMNPVDIAGRIQPDREHWDSDLVKQYAYIHNKDVVLTYRDQRGLDVAEWDIDIMLYYHQLGFDNVLEQLNFLFKSQAARGLFGFESNVEVSQKIQVRTVADQPEKGGLFNPPPKKKEAPTGM